MKAYGRVDYGECSASRSGLLNSRTKEDCNFGARHRVDHSAVLNAVVTTGRVHPYRESNRDSSVFQLVA
jgi:hypothetical protein